jgi:hypothetical protein
VVPYVTADEYEPVTLAERPGRTYPVDAIWVDTRDSYDGIVGAVVVERDRPVARWKQLERVAYGTDGGLGGITTVEWAAKEKSLDNEVQRRWEELVDRGRQSFAIDADGVEGIDTIAFAKGSETGACRRSQATTRRATGWRSRRGPSSRRGVSRSRSGSPRPG